MELIWADHLLFIVLGIILPWRMMQGAQAIQLRDIDFDTKLKLTVYYGNSAYLWLVTGLVALVWYLTDRPWDLIGLVWPPPQWPVSAIVIASLFVVLYLADAIAEIATPEQRESTREAMRTNLGFLPATSFEFAHYLFLAFSAGFCEEFIFRGYFIRYFQVLLGPDDPNHTLAILLPAIMFGVAHFYQGWKTVVKVTAMAIMFGFIFLQTDSIWLLILLHFLVDVAGGAIAWKLLGEELNH